MEGLVTWEYPDIGCSAVELSYAILFWMQEAMRCRNDAYRSPSDPLRPHTALLSICRHGMILVKLNRRLE